MRQIKIKRLISIVLIATIVIFLPWLFGTGLRHIVIEDPSVADCGVTIGLWFLGFLILWFIVPVSGFIIYVLYMGWCYINCKKIEYYNQFWNKKGDKFMEWYKSHVDVDYTVNREKKLKRILNDE